MKKMAPEERKRKYPVDIRKYPKPKPHPGPYPCHICKDQFVTIRELVEHFSSSHAGATLICPFEGCQYSSEDILQLRTHQYELNHFLYE